MKGLLLSLCVEKKNSKAAAGYRWFDNITMEFTDPNPCDTAAELLLWLTKKGEKG
jgi:hypothetical protein